MVQHEGEKMSKSLGNLIMVRDLLRDWSPDAIRLYLASHHYRQPWSHNPKELASAAQLAGRLLEAVTIQGGRGARVDPGEFATDFYAAMDEDLNTPEALQVMDRLADTILSGARDGDNVQVAQEALRAMSRVFGLRLDAEGPDERVQEGWQAHLKRFAASGEG